jgi:hypothetical protein
VVQGSLFERGYAYVGNSPAVLWRTRCDSRDHPNGCWSLDHFGDLGDDGLEYAHILDNRNRRGSADSSISLIRLLDQMSDNGSKEKR